MEETETNTEAASSPVDFIVAHSDEIVEHVSDYGYVLADSLYFIVAGMLAVFVLHSLASRFLYPYFPNARLLRVVFGTLYVLVLVIVVMAAIRRIGLDTGPLGSILVLVVLVAAVVVYFLIPFLPKLPFKPGHMITTGGVLGTVDSISSFHTTIRKFDGNMVFLPNALVMASKIENYSYTPTRRIALELKLPIENDPAAVQSRVLELITADARVKTDPAPVMYASSADSAGLSVVFYCWVDNADYMSTNSDLWLQLVKYAREDNSVVLASSRQDVHLVDER